MVHLNRMTTLSVNDYFCTEKCSLAYHQVLAVKINLKESLCRKIMRTEALTHCNTLGRSWPEKVAIWLWMVQGFSHSPAIR